MKEIYKSPIGNLIIVAEKGALLEVNYMRGNEEFRNENTESTASSYEDGEVIEKTKKWLDRYFQGEPVGIDAIDVKFNLKGSDFAKSVWGILMEIPYGETTTYGDIAAEIGNKRGIKKMSAQAVGGAVGKNPISIIIPCHRVIGKDGSMTGYGGGLERKIFLLDLESGAAG